jgi:hypothetical protein
MSDYTDLTDLYGSTTPPASPTNTVSTVYIQQPAPSGSASSGFNWGGLFNNLLTDATKLTAIALQPQQQYYPGQPGYSPYGTPAIGASASLGGSMMPILLIGGGVLLVVMMMKGRK